MGWELPEKLIPMSVGSSWAAASREWELDYIEMLEKDDDLEECLCSHYPIRELCHIRNKNNGNTAVVGNHCIGKFGEDGASNEELEHVPRIFQACHRILSKESASANPPLIELALKNKIFTEKDAQFYHEIWRKKDLTSRQALYKSSLNQELLYRIILTKRAVFQKLRTNFKETAGPKLIDYAFQKGVLKPQDKDFYMKVWKQAHGSLSSRQQSYKEGLNKRIVQNLQSELGAAPRPASPRASTSASATQTASADTPSTSSG